MYIDIIKRFWLKFCGVLIFLEATQVDFKIGKDVKAAVSLLNESYLCP